MQWHRCKRVNSDGAIIVDSPALTHFAKDQLNTDKDYFETLLNSVLSGIVVVDGETHIVVDENSAALSFIGATKEIFWPIK